MSVAYQHVRETPVPPSQVDSEVTPAMDAIVLKSLSKDPRDRYQDAFEMREDIQRALSGQPVLAAMPTETPTQVITNEAMTTTARRAAVPAAAPAAPVVASAPTPVEVVAEPDERKSRKGVIALAVITGLVLIGMIIGIFMVLNPPPKEEPTTKAVPAVINLSEADAVRALQRDGFESKVTPVVGTTENKGKVVDQNPKPETPAEPGSEVEIMVSGGPELRKIPGGITEVPVATAKELLGLAGFKNVREVEADPTTEPVTAVKGHVISSNPATGAEVNPEDEVVLTVATGKSPVPVLRQLTQAEAQTRAERSGFTLNPTEEEYEYAQPGTVFEQDPAADQLVDRGSKINVKIAVAPPTPTPSPTPSPSPSPSPTETTSEPAPPTSTVTVTTTAPPDPPTSSPAPDPSATATNETTATP